MPLRTMRKGDLFIRFQLPDSNNNRPQQIISAFTFMSNEIVDNTERLSILLIVASGRF